MRTETVTRTIYTYAELMDSEQVSERAKERAADRLRDMAWEPGMVTETLQEAAQEVLGEDAYVKILGWDAGRGQNVDFEAKYELPLVSSEWPDAPTFSMDGLYSPAYKVNLTRQARSDWGSEFFLYSVEDNEVQDAWSDSVAYDRVYEFHRELESWLVGLAVSEIDHLNSDENIAAFAEANEVEFDEHGDLV